MDKPSRSPQQKAPDRRAEEPPHLPLLRFLFHVGLLGSGLVGGYTASNLFVESRYARISSDIQASFEANRAELLGEIDALHKAVKFERQRAELVGKEKDTQLENEKKRHEREEKSMRDKLKGTGEDLVAAQNAAEANRKKVDRLNRLTERKVKEERLLKMNLAKAEEGQKEAKKQVEEVTEKLSETNKALFDKSRKLKEYLTVDRQLARSKQEVATLRNQLDDVRADHNADATKQRNLLDAEVKRREQKHQEEMGVKEEALLAMDGKRKDAEEKLAAMTRQYSQLQQTLAEMSRQREQ